MVATEQQELWLGERKKGIGGSDAAAVLAEGYGCPRALFYDKSGVEPDYEHTDAEKGFFERGHALEPLIADRFARETGMRVRRMPTRINAERPWMRVNCDRMIPSQAATLSQGLIGPGYLECKTANQHVFANMQEEGMPNHYVLQMQHGLATTGWKWGAFAVLEPYTFRFMHFIVKRHAELIHDVILPTEEAFWQQVQAGDVPAALPDFNDSRCEKCVYRRGCRNAEALPKVKYKKPVYPDDESDSIRTAALQLKQLDVSIEHLESLKKQVRGDIQQLMGDRPRVAVPSQGVKFCNTWQNGRLTWDGRALDAEQPQLADKYKRRGEGFMTLRSYDMAEVAE
jgi:predicted phage-related endonuclease